MADQLMRGRKGAWGHARQSEEGRKLVLGGLPPGKDAALYVMDSGGVRLCQAGRIGEGGGVSLTGPEEGTLFLACDGEVYAWEPGASPEETYLRACAALKRTPKKAAPKEKPQPEKPTEPPANQPAPEPYALRPISGEKAVTELPELIWPKGREELREYFEALPPFAPFYIPGWRFVRVPSPLPGRAYCALGRYIRNDRVARIAYAVPGTPQRPPAALPGYRYHQGYWVMEQQAERPEPARIREK